MNFVMPTKHQVAVAGTHVVVGVTSAIAALAYFGVLSPAQVQDANNDVHRIAADLADLYSAGAGLIAIITMVFAAVRSGPLASLFRAARDISADPAKLAKVQNSTGFEDKVAIVTITDKLPEVAGVTTVDTSMGKSLATAVPSPTVAVVKVLVAALALSLLIFSSAQAAPKPTALPATADEPTSKCLIPWDPLKLCGALTGKPEEDFQRVVKRVQAIGRDDMNYAILKATAANTSSSKVRLQCLNAIMDAKNAAEGTNIKDANGNVVPRPDPALVTGIEDIAELVDALSPTGPLMTGCAGTAQLFKTNTLAAINGLVTGAAGLAAGGFAIP